MPRSFTPSPPAPPEARVTRPRREQTRLVGIDLARFIALIGMMAVHLMPFSGADNHVPMLTELSTGNASTLFAVISGISIVLATRRYLARGEAWSAVVSVAVRAALVIAIGFTLGLMEGSVVVVLVYMGVAMLCAVPFLWLRPVWLFLAAAVLAVVGPVANAALRGALEVVNAGGSVSWESLADPAEALRAIFVTGTYPVITWLVYILVGMGLARLIFQAREAQRDGRMIGILAIWGAALTAVSLIASTLIYQGAGRAAMMVAMPDLPGEMLDLLVASTGFGAPMGTDIWSLLLATPHTGTAGDIMRGVGVSMIVLAVCLAIERWAPTRVLGLLRPVASAGAAPLTIYTLHVVAASLAFSAMMALAGPEGAAEVEWWFNGPWILLIHVLGALLIGLLLSALHRRGPLEWATSTVAGAAARAVGRAGTGQPRRTSYEQPYIHVP